MSISSRRKTKELQDVLLPKRQKEIQEICGGTVEFDVDWESFGDDVNALILLDRSTCGDIVNALKRICTDELGKKAVRESLKTILLGRAGSESDKVVKFDGGIFEVRLAHRESMPQYVPGEFEDVLDKAL